MKGSIRIWVACLFVSLTQAVLAQNAKAPKAKAQAVAPWARHAALMGPAFVCPAESSTCNVPVTMSQGSINGVSVCLATLAGEIKVAGTSVSAAPKDIIWTLTPATLPGVEVFFESKSGILVLADANGQLKVVGPGTTPAQFKVRNKRNKAGDSIYLPVILQRDLTTGAVSLCAASDPKIVNF